MGKKVTHKLIELKVGTLKRVFLLPVAVWDLGFGLSSSTDAESVKIQSLNGSWFLKNT